MNGWRFRARRCKRFRLRAQRVVVEVDGWNAPHERSFENDRRRDQLLRLHGWQVVRFTWDDVTKRPAHVVAVVSAMLSTSVDAKPTPRTSFRVHDRRRRG